MAGVQPEDEGAPLGNQVDERRSRLASPPTALVLGAFVLVLFVLAGVLAGVGVVVAGRQPCNPETLRPTWCSTIACTPEPCRSVRWA